MKMKKISLSCLSLFFILSFSVFTYAEENEDSLPLSKKHLYHSFDFNNSLSIGYENVSFATRFAYENNYSGKIFFNVSLGVSTLKKGADNVRARSSKVVTIQI